jgi:ArsR family transcriptional regulator, arsenate/arsenite/antimonite-responsive transcriptional repressor
MSNSEEQIERLSTIFKALSNPNRLKIMLEFTHCSKGGQGFAASIGIDQVENCQKEFAKHLNLAPSTISHHFKELRLAGLLKMQKQGKNIMVSVNEEVINTLRNLF